MFAGGHFERLVLKSPFVALLLALFQEFFSMRIS
jgi:hypothetical protein